MSLMNKSELSDLWLILETKIANQQKPLQQLIAPDSLFRLYIGVQGLPAHRFVSIEIPEKKKKQILDMDSLQGIDISIGEPPVAHDGFCSCVLQSSSYDQNDVFSIVAEDILIELESCETEDSYVDVLVERIAKWREFFKRKHKPLTESEVIGLFGELQFAKEMMEQGVANIIDYWSGPIKSAQDFKSLKVCSEIKTKVADQLTSVKISSEEQLNNNDDIPMYLVVYRLEKSASGMTIHDMVLSVSEQLSDSRKKIFDAKLLCLGYQKEDEYDSKYSTKESRQYIIENGFPRITTPSLPTGTYGVTYNLSLDKCDVYRVGFEQLIDSFKEASDG